MESSKGFFRGSVVEECICHILGLDPWDWYIYLHPLDPKKHEKLGYNP